MYYINLWPFIIKQRLFRLTAGCYLQYKTYDSSSSSIKLMISILESLSYVYISIHRNKDTPAFIIQAQMILENIHLKTSEFTKNIAILPDATFDVYTHGNARSLK